SRPSSNSPLLPIRDHKWKIPVPNGLIYWGHVTFNPQFANCDALIEVYPLGSLLSMRKGQDVEH
ncbi:hypothetical protein AB9F46_34700, partial [Rhizobium leguminosarum]|uniref:hypothetical protein n=1 Tax=Rhizobium leguminosarum TaxID=384 RepID=UPI003F9C07F9